MMGMETTNHCGVNRQHQHRLTRPPDEYASGIRKQRERLFLMSIKCLTYLGTKVRTVYLHVLTALLTKYWSA